MTDPRSILSSLVVLAVVLYVVIRMTRGASTPLRGRAPRNRTTTEVVLSIFALSNFIASPSAAMLTPTITATAMVCAIVGLAVRPRLSGTAIAVVGLAAAVLDLAFDSPDLVIPVAIVALLAAALFAETRVLTRETGWFRR